MQDFDYIEIGKSKFDKKHIPKSRIVDNAENLFKTAESLFLEDKFESAIEYYDKAIGLEYTYFKAWVGKIFSYVRMKDLASSEEFSERALKSFGRVSVFYAARALVLLHQGKLQKALDYSDISLQKDVNTFYPYLVRAEIIISRQYDRLRVQHAMDNFKQFLSMANNHWSSFLRAANILYFWKCYKTARDMFRDAMLRNPDNPLLRFKLGIAYRSLGNYKKAKRYFQDALKINPSYQPAKTALEEKVFFKKVGQFFREMRDGLSEFIE